MARLLLPARSGQYIYAQFEKNLRAEKKIKLPDRTDHIHILPFFFLFIYLDVRT